MFKPPNFFLHYAKLEIISSLFYTPLTKICIQIKFVIIIIIKSIFRSNTNNKINDFNCNIKKPIS